VFEGKAPDLKREELAKRGARRAGATEELEAAREAGNQEDIEKYSKRTVRVTREHNEECKRLLRLMGVPVIEAPGEAEAQCAQLCKDGAVYGISTEDMDSLTFATPRLIRHLMAPASQKQAVTEFHYDDVLRELGLTADQFVDLCILCGCDYTDKIPGIGPVRALGLVQKHGSLEAVLAALDPEKYKIPDPFPYEEARRLFKNPDVLAGAAVPPLKWSAPDAEGLVKFLVEEKSFAEKRVRDAVDRINAAKAKSTQGERAAQQRQRGCSGRGGGGGGWGAGGAACADPRALCAAGRLESFFGAPTKVTSTTGAKRKDEKPPKGGKGGNKKGKAGGVGGGKK
jgi:flap endonuclease-1